MSKQQPVNADPLIGTVSPNAGQMDYPAHYKTYNRFLSLVKWFCMHMAFIVVSLYFLIIGNQPVFGTVLLLVGIAILVFGIIHNPNVRDDLGAVATETGPAE